MLILWCFVLHHVSFNRSSGPFISFTASLVPNSSAFDIWTPSPHLSHTFSSYYSKWLPILPIIYSLFSSLPPSWTITVHLRNPARSAVQWCPIANRFRTTPTTTTNPLYPSCLLSNLASSPPSGSSTPLPSLLCSEHLPCPLQLGPVAQKGDFPNLVVCAKGSSTCWDPGRPGTLRLLF